MVSIILLALTIAAISINVPRAAAEELIDVTIDIVDTSGEHLDDGAVATTSFPWAAAPTTFSMANGGEIWVGGKWGNLLYSLCGVSEFQIFKGITYSVDALSGEVTEANSTDGSTKINMVFEPIDVTIDTVDTSGEHLDGAVATTSFPWAAAPTTFSMANGGEIWVGGKWGNLLYSLCGVSEFQIFKGITYSVDALSGEVTEANSTDGSTKINMVFEPIDVTIDTTDQLGQHLENGQVGLHWGGLLDPSPSTYTIANGASFTPDGAWGGVRTPSGDVINIFKDTTYWIDALTRNVTTESTPGINKVNIVFEPINNIPSASSGGPYEGNEGSQITFNGSDSYDPDDYIVNWEWDLDGDGIYETNATETNGITNYTWEDDYSGNVSLKVTDSFGAVDVDDTTVTVLNVAPTITSFTGSLDPVQVDNPVSLTATFTDPGLNDTHTATFDWDDNTTTDYSLINGDREVTGTHTYTEAGVYTVTLTIEDDDGGADSEVFRYIVIYDPDGGFVTGGGWIISPEGAYTADPTLTGKANFGFVSKYKQGQQTPTGNTEFQFKAGDLNFHSSDYDWLVIAGHKAMYKGTGTINGAGNYGFMISAIDEDLTPSTDVDLFRIKIWDKDDGDAIVYYNLMGGDDDADPETEIGGGQIKIHKGE